MPDPSVSPAVNTPAAISSRPGSSLGTPQQLAQHAQQHAAPAPVHTPGMTIPLAPTAARQHQPAAMAASAEQQAAAVAAASPWAAAAALAAAVAAVQARYGSLPHGSLQQPYSAAHSLQAIVGPGQPGAMAQMTDGLGMAAMQATPPGAQVRARPHPTLAQSGWPDRAGCAEFARAASRAWLCARKWLKRQLRMEPPEQTGCVIGLAASVHLPRLSYPHPFAVDEQQLRATA